MTGTSAQQKSETGRRPMWRGTPTSAGIPFGRYRLLERIGSGGMADVYRGLALGAQGFERTVAIKRIREEVAEMADIGELFADEARVSALLDHPNIVQVYDFGSFEGAYFIVMEHLRGRNLEQVLRSLRQKKERLDPAVSIFIAREVARALAYAHDRRDESGRPLDIVHRDVSPANVMLGQVGTVKLLDFGIARVTSEFRLVVTQGPSVRGKYPYLAPEQINGGELDRRSDLFALGAVLWEMLTNQRLFTGGTDFATMANILSRDIPAPSTIVADLPAALDRIVLTALARDPEQRYQSADALVTDLNEVLRTLPGHHGDLAALLERLEGQPGDEPFIASSDPDGTPPRLAADLPTLVAADLSPKRAPSETYEPKTEPTVSTRAVFPDAPNVTRRRQRRTRDRALALAIGALAAVELLAVGLRHYPLERQTAVAALAAGPTACISRPSEVPPVSVPVPSVPVIKAPLAPTPQTRASSTKKRAFAHVAPKRLALGRVAVSSRPTRTKTESNGPFSE